MKILNSIGNLISSAKHEYNQQTGYYEVVKIKLELFLAKNPGGSVASPIPINATHYFRVIKDNKYKIDFATSEENAESRIKMYLKMHADYRVIGPYKLPGKKDSSKFK